MTDTEHEQPYDEPEQTVVSDEEPEPEPEPDEPADEDEELVADDEPDSEPDTASVIADRATACWPDLSR